MSVKKIGNVAFPKEHGSWGLTYEPLLLAVIVAYSFAGMMTALAAFFIFMSHQPIRVLLNPNLSKELKKLAFIPLLFYFVLILFFFYMAFSNGKVENFIPFFGAIFLMVIFLIIEISGEGRNIVFEFIPPTAIGLIATTIVLLGNFNPSLTLGFLVLIYSRSLTTIFFVNEKLSLQKGNKIAKIKTRLSETLFLIALVFLALESFIPAFSLIAPLIIFARAEYGLAKRRKSDTVRNVGIYEFVYGIIFIIIVSISYHLT